MNAETGYVDRHGTEIRVGDILAYDEGDDVRTLDAVVLRDGLFCSVSFAFKHRGDWLPTVKDDPIELRFHTVTGGFIGDETECTRDTVIGRIEDNPGMLLPEYGPIAFGETEADS